MQSKNVKIARKIVKIALIYFFNEGFLKCSTWDGSTAASSSTTCQNHTISIFRKFFVFYKFKNVTHGILFSKMAQQVQYLCVQIKQEAISSLEHQWLLRLCFWADSPVQQRSENGHSTHNSTEACPTLRLNYVMYVYVTN